jgi:hypothetical protein
MSGRESQIAVLRQERRVALAQYDYQRAQEIYLQIQQLQNGASSAVHSQARTSQLELECRRDLIVNHSSQTDCLLIQKKAEIAQRFLLQREAIEQSFSQDYENLCFQHITAVTRDASRPVPAAERLLHEAELRGNHDDYDGARNIYNEAMAIQKATREERCSNLEEAFAQSKRRLQERKLKDLALLADRENSAIVEVERQYQEAQKIISNQLKVKDAKLGRSPESLYSGRGSRASSRRSAATPDRTRSIVDQNSPSQRSSANWSPYRSRRGLPI